MEQQIFGLSDQILTIDIGIRIGVFLVIAIGGIMGLGLWYNRNINHLSVSKYWRLFITGVLFYAVGAFSDIFTPRLIQSMGAHNLLTENVYLIGLGLIFVSLYRFTNDYVEQRKGKTKIKDGSITKQ